jgi:hypothetical protein
MSSPVGKTQRTVRWCLRAGSFAPLAMMSIHACGGRVSADDGVPASGGATASPGRGGQSPAPGGTTASSGTGGQGGTPPAPTGGRAEAGTLSPGQPCSVDAECASGLCYSSSDAGLACSLPLGAGCDSSSPCAYCLGACSKECSLDADCGIGGVCYPPYGPLCLPSCDLAGSSPCPEGYLCFDDWSPPVCLLTSG